MSDVIAFPKPTMEPTELESIHDRITAVDRVSLMHPDELKQAVQVVDDDVRVEWLNRRAESGITHRIGSNVFRRSRAGSRILASDDVGVVTSKWLEANFEALNALRKDWGGRITMVWNLVRLEGYTAPEYVGDLWNRLVANGSPLERIVVVQNFDMSDFPTPVPTVPEPVTVVTPDELDDVLDQIEAEHRAQRAT